MIRHIPIILTLLFQAHVVSFADGVIEGKIEPADRIAAVWAISRPPREIFTIENDGRRGSFDKETGQYRVADLAPGTYDLLVELVRGKERGVTIEGVDLRSRKEAEPLYDLNMTRDSLSTTGLDVERDIGDEFASDEERDLAVRAYFRVGSLVERLDSMLKVDRFMDQSRGLYAHGGRTQAKILVMLARTRDFHAQQGAEVIWRVEAWPMTWYYGNWAKGRHYVVHRLRMNRAAYRDMGKLFDPRLGGVDVADDETATRDYTIPETLDRSMGKLPGEKF